MLVHNVVVSERASVIFRQEKERHKAIPDLEIVLPYMPSFTDADGTTVAGFSSGYTIDFISRHRGGPAWLEARLPDGTQFRFMPKFAWSADETYVVDQASAYTLSIGPAVRS